MTIQTAAFGRRFGALLFAVLFLSAIPGASSEIRIPEKPRPDEPPRAVVLTGQAALDALQGFCWEAEEATVWQPGPEEIARLEERFPAFMANLKKMPSDYQPLHEYYRQYLGIIRNGKKTICVNLFHYSFVEERLKRPHLEPRIGKAIQAGKPAEDFWKLDPIWVSDGGAYYFSVQFDVESGKFLWVAFNGHA